MNTRSIVCTNANKLVKQGYSRSEAFKKAWALAKVNEITVKVKGTTFGSRQTALEHLTRYNAADVSYVIAADVHNSHDSNAVAVVAKVKDKGAFIIGYLPAGLAANISPLLRAGLVCRSTGWVTGKYQPYMNYGATVRLMFA